MNTLTIQHALRCESLGLAAWTGLGDLEIEGVTYTGIGQVLDIGAASSGQQQPARMRIAAMLGNSDDAIQAAYTDYGSPAVVVRVLSAVAGGWQELPSLRFVGRLSSTSIAGGRWEAEIESYRAAQPPEARYWSKADWKDDNPGDESLDGQDGLRGTPISWPHST